MRNDTLNHVWGFGAEIVVRQVKDLKHKRHVVLFDKREAGKAFACDASI